MNNPKWFGKDEDTDNLQLAWEVIELAKVTVHKVTRKMIDGKKKNANSD